MPRKIDHEQVRYGLGYIAGTYQLGATGRPAMIDCDYCTGHRSPCTCTEDCGTTESPIGPCPESEEGKQAIKDWYKQYRHASEPS